MRLPLVTAGLKEIASSEGNNPKRGVEEVGGKCKPFRRRDAQLLRKLEAFVKSQEADAMPAPVLASTAVVRPASVAHLHAHWQASSLACCEGGRAAVA